MITTQVVFAS